MRRTIPGLATIRSANKELPAFWRDARLLGSVVAWTRAQALKEEVGSPRRRGWVALNRGFVGNAPMWKWWKRRRLRDLPDAAGDDAAYRAGFAAGEFLAPVMLALVADLRHSDLSNPGALVVFAFRYGMSMTMSVATDGGDRKSVLEWIRERETLLRAHAAATYEAESSGYGVGERIELEFLRALSTRSGVPLPLDAGAWIAERRRDARNLPVGIDWSELPEPAPAGGPLDGAGNISPKAAEELRKRVRRVEWRVMLDSRSDGAGADRGILAGMTAKGHVPLVAPQGTDPVFHTGRLFGSLDGALIRSRGGSGVDLMRASYAYARALASPRGQALLREPRPDALLMADALARYMVRRQGTSLDDADALAFFNWLAEQAEVAVTPALLQRREHVVVGSIGGAQEEPPEAPAHPGD